MLIVFLSKRFRILVLECFVTRETPVAPSAADNSRNMLMLSASKLRSGTIK